MPTCRANAEWQTTEHNDRGKEAVAHRCGDMKYMLAAVSASSKDSIPKHMQAALNPVQNAIVYVHIACRPAARGKGVNKACVLQSKEFMAIALYGEHAQKKCHARIIQKTQQLLPLLHSSDGAARHCSRPSRAAKFVVRHWRQSLWWLSCYT